MSTTDFSFERLEKDIGTLLGGVFGPLANNFSSIPIRTWRQDQTTFVEAEVPGVSEDALEITAKDRDLTISASRKQRGMDGQLLDTPRKLERTVTLDHAIDANKIQATLRHGILLLEVPINEPASATKIPIKNTD